MRRKGVKNFYFVLIVIIFIIALLHTVNSFNLGYIASWDGSAHLVRAEHFYNSLNPEMLGYMGWYHGWYLGVAPFIFYTPGLFIVLSLLKSITFGLASMQLIIKILLSLTYALFPIILYWLSTTLGFSKRISIIAGVLSLSFSAIWGIGLSGLYSIGLYTQIFSLLPFMIFWGIFHKTLVDKGDPIKTGLLLGFIIITNMITAVFTLIVISTYIILLQFVRKKTKWIKILQLLVIGILSSIFWTFPFLNSRNLFGQEAGFNTLGLIELIKNLFLGKIIFHPVVSVFLILGILFSLYTIYKKRSKSFSYLVIILLFCTTLLVSSTLLTNLTLSWQSSNFILRMISRVFRSLLRTRALSFIWIIVPVISAIGVDSILKTVSKYADKKVVDKISIVVLLSVLLFSYAQLFIIAEKNVKTTDHKQYKIIYEEWDSSFKWLKTNAPRNSVVLTDINWTRFHSPGTISIDSLINLETGLRTVNGNQIEATQINSWDINHLKFEDTEREGRELHKFNVDYIFSYGKWDYNTSYLKKVYKSKNIIIYNTVNLTGPYEIIEYELGPNTYRIELNVFSSGEIELPLQYNNHWHAYVNGEEKEVKRGNIGLVELNLEKGVNDITFIFEKTLTEFYAFLISLYTMVFCILWPLYNKYVDYSNSSP